MDTTPGGGVSFSVTSLEQATQWIIDRASARTRSGLPIRLANAWCVVLANSDQSYGEVIRGPGVNLPDGAPVAWAMRLSRPAARRVRGPSLFESVLAQGQRPGTRHFFLGGTPERNTRMIERLTAKYPNLNVAGSIAPPFAPLEDSLIAIWATEIERTEADIVWIGLGTPKQDYAARSLSEQLGIDCIGVGAAFDFASGHVPASPRWVSAIGFEWIYRLAREPRRLWRRYLFGNVQFLYFVFTRRGRR